MRLAIYLDLTGFLCVAVFILFVFYSKGTETKSKAHELLGSPAERIDIVEEILLRNLTTIYDFESVGQSVVVSPKSRDNGIGLPSGIDEAFLVEEFTDHGFAPSEIKSFFAFRVPKNKIRDWTERLTEIVDQGVAEYEEPQAMRQWWIDRKLFSDLELYEPRELTGKSVGWVGVDVETGRIYAYSMDL